MSAFNREGLTRVLIEMRKGQSYQCRSCTASGELLLCQNCASLSCNSCLIEEIYHTYFCNGCEIQLHTNICGRCGQIASLHRSNTLSLCPVCKSNELGDPYDLVESLPRQYYDTLAAVQDIGEQVQKLHRLYEKVMTHILYSRISGLLGFPEIEKKLTFLSVLLFELNEEGLKLVQNLKKETYYDLRTVEYFKELSLELYRVAYSKVKSLRERMEVLKSVSDDFIENIETEFVKFMPLFELLHLHRKTYLSIRDFLNINEQYVVAAFPPIQVKAQLPLKRRMRAYIVLGEDALHLLPDNDDPASTKISIDHHQIYQASKKYDPIRGLRIKIKGQKCDITIRGSNEELETIIGYLHLILQQDKAVYQIGSDKDIQKLNNNIPTSYQLVQEITEFLDIVSERLFNSDRTTNSYNPTFSPNDVREMLERINKDRIHLNNMVKAGKIQLYQYTEEIRKLMELERAYKNLLPSYSKPSPPVKPEDSVGNYLQSLITEDSTLNTPSNIGTEELHQTVHEYEDASDRYNPGYYSRNSPRNHRMGFSEEENANSSY